MISTRSIAAEGRVLMSTAIEALLGVARRPSIRTRLRFEPMPRSEIVAEPGVFDGEAWMSPPCVGFFSGTNWGRRFRLTSTDEVLEFSSRSAPTVTIGLLA